MLRDGFKEFVAKVWSQPCKGSNIVRWQNKTRILRQKIRGWNLNADAAYRKRQERNFS